MQDGSDQPRAGGVAGGGPRDVRQLAAAGAGGAAAVLRAEAGGDHPAEAEDGQRQAGRGAAAVAAVPPPHLHRAHPARRARHHGSQAFPVVQKSSERFVCRA